MQPKQLHERRAPNVMVLLLAVLGVGGTGVGVVRSSASDHEANISRQEADRAIAQRNRYEDGMQHCIERQIDALRGK